MSGKREPGRRFRHVAVHLADHILVIGGKWELEPEFQREIWKYNLYTGKWKRYVISQNEDMPPPLESACAAALGSDVLLFGGFDYSKYSTSNSMWKLNTSCEGCFVWNKINTKQFSTNPSPREEHSGWEYRENLYIFGGYGPPLRGYLSEHGDFELTFEMRELQLGCNNQLLRFDPSTETWTNLNCSGSVPKPQRGHSTTRIRENVWLFGGNDEPALHTGLFELNMHTLLWTEIQNIQTDQLARSYCTLTAVSDSQLLLHGGQNIKGVVLSDTLILDLPSQTWREYSAYKKQKRHGHTCTAGTNRGDCLIIGGSCSKEPVLDHEHKPPNGYRTVCHVTLQPLSLQQLASRVIYKHKSNLRWKNLPPKLISLLELSKNDSSSWSMLKCLRKCIGR